MYFQSTIRGKKWEIEVHEQRLHWLISLQQEGKERESFKISKTEYCRMDDAISFLFKNSSYMMDVVPTGLDHNVYTRGSYRTVPLINDEGLLHESLKGGGSLAAADKITAGMPGKIVRVLVKPGDAVTARQPILVMEAMKMENELRATHDAKIKDVIVKEGQSVESGALLVVFE